MAKCEHYEICGLDADVTADDRMCILHSPKPNKNTDDFKKTLQRCFKVGIYDSSHKKYDFSRIVFPRGVDVFRDLEFDQWVSFFLATFSGHVDFSHANFTKGVNFSGTKFTKGVKFLDTKFMQITNFTDAEFGNKTDSMRGADFERAMFAGEVSFANAIFNGNALFGGARFVTQADFYGITFKQDALFHRATFSGGVDFSNATFEKGGGFSWARFLGRTLFISGKNKPTGLIDPIFSGAEVDFGEAVIDPLDALVIRDADLQKCKFQGTDLRRAEITNAKWPKKEGRYQVYDEEIMLREGDTGALPHIERLYRELKQNYEDRRDYERARDFHYGEKEMRRRNPDTPRWLRYVLWLYRSFSGYGERCLRPLVGAFLIIVACMAGYIYFGLWSNESKSMLNPSDWLSALNYSFRVATLLRPDDLVPVGNTSKWVHTFESVAGPLLFGLFALALRQRLKR